MPRGARKRAEAINFDADSPPRSEKSSFCRTAGSRRPVGAIFRRCLSIFGFFAKCEISVSYHACQQKQRFGPSRCESSRSRVATSKNTKIGSKIDPKSSKIASRGRSGGLLGRLLSLEAPRSSDAGQCKAQSGARAPWSRLRWRGQGVCPASKGKSTSEYFPLCLHSERRSVI